MSRGMVLVANSGVSCGNPVRAKSGYRGRSLIIFEVLGYGFKSASPSGLYPD